MKYARYMLVVLCLVYGCGKDDISGDRPGAECVVAEDCGGDRVCRAGVCSVEEDEPRGLGFRLTPPPMSSYPPQSVPIRALPLDEPVQIGLDPGARVAGTLRYIGSDSGPGTGRLQFARRGDDFKTDVALQDNTYEVFVPAGRYDVTFLPPDELRCPRAGELRCPTWVWPDIEIELDTDPQLALADQVVAIEGTLSRNDATTGAATFVGGAMVFATNAESGVTSSVSETDESGNFVISVPLDSGDFDLHVAPIEANSIELDAAGYVPEATFESAFTVDAERWENRLPGNEGADILAVSLGNYAYAPVSVPVRLKIDGPEVRDWSGTVVTLRTSVGQGTISVRARLGTMGGFDAPLLLGLYDAIIRTPPELGVRSMELTGIELTAEGVDLVLQPRTNVSGTVVGPDGEPISDAEVRFRPLVPGALVDDVTATTDAAGVFKVWLDEQDYVMNVVPIEPSLPRVTRIVAHDAVPDEIAIPEPVLVWGTILGTPSSDDDDFKLVPEVSVQVVEQSGGRELVVGEAQSNDRGEFKVVIAARP